MRNKTGRTRAAFTLVELLVALSIIIILTVLGMPAIGPMIKAKSTDSAANIIKGALMHARNTAVAEATEGYCWLAPGAVFDSGVTQAMVAESDPFTVIINDNDSTWATEGNVSYKCSLEGSGWVLVSQSSSYDGQLHYAWGGGSGANVAKWVFKFSVPVTAKVYVRYREDNDRTTVTYKVYHKEATPYLASVNQKLPGDHFTATWTLLREEEFGFNADTEYRVEINDTYGTSSNKVAIDAVKLVGDVASGDPNTECMLVGKSWTANAWAGYYVVISNASGSSTQEPIVAQIQSNTDTKLTVASWQPNNPRPGSRALIVRGDPRTTSTARTATIGSGTEVSARWDRLPDNVEVCPKDAVNGTRLVFPILFTSVGRARFTNDSANDSVTIKVRDKEEPNNKDLWRFIRVYRNTGRTVVAKELSALP